MSRFIVPFCLLPLLLCSVGCRMCHSPYDCCIPAYIDRCDDFRGCGPLYRAGSILTNGGCSTCQTVIGDAIYEGNTGDFYINAGNYGITTPVATVRRNSDSFEFPLRQDQHSQDRTIAIPLQKPQEEDIIFEPGRNVPINSLPTIEDLIKQPKRESLPMPIIPPAKPKVVPPFFEGTPIESSPFSPSDEVVPPNVFPPITTKTDPPITLEELRRLDPSVRDFQIISIEDADTGTVL